MKIIITMLDGNHLNLRVHPDLTVGSLKTLIQQKLGYVPESQKLTFDNGQMITLSDDSKPVSSYGLHSGCQVSLLVTQPQLPQPATIQVFLKKYGMTKTYDIKSNETVSNFRCRVQRREGVQNDQFRLVYEGKDMMDGKLSDYKVRALSTIYMTLRLRSG